MEICEYLIVGHCPTCGAPIYAPVHDAPSDIRSHVSFDADEEPYSKFTCKCNEYRWEEEE